MEVWIFIILLIPGGLVWLWIAWRTKDDEDGDPDSKYW